MASATRDTIIKELRDAERDVKDRMDPTKKRKRNTSKSSKTSKSTTSKKKSATTKRKTNTTSTKRKSNTNYKKKSSNSKNRYMDIVETIFASEGLPRILRLALGFLILGFIIYGYYRNTLLEEGKLLFGNTLIDLEFLSNVFWKLAYTGFVFFLGYKYSEKRRKG